MIIWLEDDIGYSSLFARKIRKISGSEPIVVNNPDELYAKINGLSPSDIDLFIFDIQMATGTNIDKSESKDGTLTGFIVLKNIKEEASPFNSVPVIVLTNKDDSDLEVYCDKHGIPYIKKEDSNQKFYDTLQEVIK